VLASYGGTSIDDINRISRVELLPEHTRTADVPIRKRVGRVKHAGMDADEDEFHMQPEESVEGHPDIDIED
jgi:hypothetical protein